MGCGCSEKLNRCAKIELYPQKAFHVDLFIFLDYISLTELSYLDFMFLGTSFIHKS